MPYTDKKKAETIDGPTLAALRQPVSYETLGAVIMALEHQYYLREVSVRPSEYGAYLEVYDADWERLVEPEEELHTQTMQFTIRHEPINVVTDDSPQPTSIVTKTIKDL
ncbi:MAG: hypothetical protein AAFY91_14775 [Bacteroidota bacterium]